MASRTSSGKGKQYTNVQMAAGTLAHQDALRIERRIEDIEKKSGRLPKDLQLEFYELYVELDGLKPGKLTSQKRKDYKGSIERMTLEKKKEEAAGERSRDIEARIEARGRASKGSTSLTITAAQPIETASTITAAQPMAAASTITTAQLAVASTPGGGGVGEVPRKIIEWSDAVRMCRANDGAEFKRACEECDMNRSLLDDKGNGDCMQLIIARYAQPGFARIMRQHGYNMNTTHAKGNTPLMGAATLGRLEMVKCLVNIGTDVKAMDTDGGTAAHLAAVGGHTKTLNYLYSKGAERDKPTDLGETPDALLKAYTVWEVAEKKKVAAALTTAKGEAADADHDVTKKRSENWKATTDYNKYLKEKKKPGDAERESELHENYENAQKNLEDSLAKREAARENVASLDGVSRRLQADETEEEEEEEEEEEAAVPAAAVPDEEEDGEDEEEEDGEVPAAAAPAAAAPAVAVPEDDEDAEEEEEETDLALLVRDAAESNTPASLEMLGSVEQINAMVVDGEWTYQGTAKNGGIIVNGPTAWFSRHFFKNKPGMVFKKTLHENEGKNITVPPGSAPLVSNGICESAGEKGEAGVTSGNGGMTVAPPGSLNVTFKQRNSNICGLCAMLNGLDKLGFGDLARDIKKTSQSPSTSLSTDEVIELLRNEHKFEIRKETKLYATAAAAHADPKRLLLMPLLLDPENHTLYKNNPVIATLSKAGHKNYHAILLHNGFIFCSNQDVALPVTEENLDRCVFGKCTGVTSARQIIPPKKSKKRKHEPDQSTTRNKKTYS
jgi:hypothetical protein